MTRSVQRLHIRTLLVKKKQTLIWIWVTAIEVKAEVYVLLAGNTAAAEVNTISREAIRVRIEQTTF